jgi:hypothetical protein
MVRIVWGKDQVHMACLKGLAFTFDGKNQRQWGVTCNIE